MKKFKITYLANGKKEFPQVHFVEANSEMEARKQFHKNKQKHIQSVVEVDSFPESGEYGIYNDYI